MQFLVDECCDAVIVRVLRAADHDVVYIAEQDMGATDGNILSQSVEEARILITEDRDFCELVYRDQKSAYGIVLVRVPVSARQQKGERIKLLVETYGNTYLAKYETSQIVSRASR